MNVHRSWGPSARGAALLALVCAACGGEGDSAGTSRARGEHARSVVLVTLDTTRADALSSYGGTEGLTPHLDALAEESLVFDRAYTVVPLTLPSHASMLTGLIPPRHGLRVNGASRLPEEAVTFAEVARAGGMETAAFVSAVVLDAAFGLAQGFEEYDAPSHSLVQADSHYADRTGTEVVDRASAWLRARDPGTRFFLWVHLWDPHGPWDPPPELRARAPHDETGYLGDVALADQAFGRLMETLRTTGHADEAMVVVVADHGEAFWEHGEYSHGALLFEPTMRVPLIVRFHDGHRAGERSDAIASVVDLFPTMSAALGLEAPRMSVAVDGRDLRSEPDGGQAYLESYYGHLAYGWAPVVGLVDENGKYLFGGRPKLFDPAADPEERADLARERSEDLAAYRRAIQELAARPALEPQGTELDPARDAGIAALGYVETRVEDELPAPHAPVDLPDPHARIGEHAAMLEALGAFNAGDYPEAERQLRKALAGNPESVVALERLGVTLIRLRRFEDAVEPLERAFASGRGTASGAVNLGTCYRKLERLAEALATFERAVEIDGSQVRAIRHLVDLNLMAGRRDEAQAHARRYEELTGEALPLQ